MRITDLLKSESIMLGAQPKDKNDAIAILTGLMEKGGNLSDKAQYEKDVLAREASGTTGLGDGIAAPRPSGAAPQAQGARRPRRHRAYCPQCLQRPGGSGGLRRLDAHGGHAEGHRPGLFLERVGSRLRADCRRRSEDEMAGRAGAHLHDRHLH